MEIAEEEATFLPQEIESAQPIQKIERALDLQESEESSPLHEETALSTQNLEKAALDPQERALDPQESEASSQLHEATVLSTKKREKALLDLQEIEETGIGSLPQKGRHSDPSHSLISQLLLANAKEKTTKN